MSCAGAGVARDVLQSRPMKRIYLVTALSLVLGLVACKKKETTESKPATPAEGTSQPGDTASAKPTEPVKPAKAGRAIPNSQGLVVEAPAKWLDNGIGGAAGMHLDADAGQFQVREPAPEEAAKPLAAWKGETEQLMFQKWLSAEETPDGFKAIYVMDKLEMKGEEMVKAGSTFAFHTRRKIGDKVHDCYGSAATQEIAAEAVDLCMKIQAE